MITEQEWLDILAKTSKKEKTKPRSFSDIEEEKSETPSESPQPTGRRRSQTMYDDRPQEIKFTPETLHALREQWKNNRNPHSPSTTTFKCLQMDDNNKVQTLKC